MRVYQYLSLDMLSPSPSNTVNILLADDDNDDYSLFKEAIEELPVIIRFSIVQNGQELMQLLNSDVLLPDMLFLDLNMPGKKGLACLLEIRANEKLNALPVIIYTTSFYEDIVNLLYNNGAQYYIRKPIEFTQLKDLIKRAILAVQNLQLDQAGCFMQPSEEDFIISTENYYNENK